MTQLQVIGVGKLVAQRYPGTHGHGEEADTVQPCGSKQKPVATEIPLANRCERKITRDAAGKSSHRMIILDDL